MFTRPEYTYDIDLKSMNIADFLKDVASSTRAIADKIDARSKVLDVGCGSGLLGWLVNGLAKDVIMDGVEPSKYALNLAKPYYRNLYEGYFQEVCDQFNVSEFDYIILGDVVEHVYDPYTFLKLIKEKMREDAKILLSIPNIAHGSVRMGLLNGEFKYEDSGLLEVTHIRFFTRDTITQMFSKLGLYIREINYLQRPFSIPDNSALRLTKKSIRNLKSDILANTFQFMFVLQLFPCETKSDVFFNKQETVSTMNPVKRIIKYIKKILKKVRAK